MHREDIMLSEVSHSHEVPRVATLRGQKGEVGGQELGAGLGC